MQHPNGITLPNFQQTINNNNNITCYSQLQQQQYFNNNNTNNSDTFYQIQQQQQQLYQSQQISTGEVKEIQQQQITNNIEQFSINNNENKIKKGPGPGRPPKHNKIDNSKREDVTGCSNIYEYNNNGILKPDEMQMLSLEAKSASLMAGGSTTQCNLSSVQFPYGDASSNACFGNQTNFDISSMASCPQDYNNVGVTWASHPSNYGLTTVPNQQLCGGFTEIDNIGLYANTNGLIALPGQLQYELDPMLATAYDVWPAVNSYYMNTEPGKLLTTDGSIQSSQQPLSQQYMVTASTSNNYIGDNSQATTTTFYGTPASLQNILPSSIDQTSVFHTGISTLPPPPSQLATADQLYGLQNGVFGRQLTSIDSLPPSSNILPISNNTKPETSNTPITLLNLEQCSSSNGNQFIRQQEQEQQNQLLFVGNSNEHNNNIQKIEENNINSTILPSTTIPTTLSLISAPQIGTISSTTSTGRKYKSKKNNQSKNILLSSRPSTSKGGLFSSKISRNESPFFMEKSKNQRDISSRNGRKSRSHSLLKDSDDDSRSAEEREVERRNANNTRERIRVRDINAAFKELARLCCNHMPNLEERNLTKLNTLIKAVELIPQLEQKVNIRTQMRDPRGECVNQRMQMAPPILVDPSASSNGVLDARALFGTCGSSSDMSSSLTSSSNYQQHHFE